MKITLVQSHIIFEDKDVNIERAQIIAAEHRGADLILFPEMSFTGFSMNTSLTADSGFHTIERMKDLAYTNNMYVGFGYVREGKTKSDKCENVYTIMSPEREVVSEYVKIHPFSYSGEDKYFKGGDSINTFIIDGVHFGYFICYDLRFPELFRTIADRVHAVIIPANWPAKRSEHWKALLKARAIENQVYIFAINCYGNMDGQYYSGDSCVINPNGEVLVMLSDKEGVVTYDFNDDVGEYRSAFPVLRDRKAGLYKDFLR